MARVQSIGYTFRIAAEKTLAETHRIFVATAKREHAKVMAAEPRPASFTRIVDGQVGAREEAVKPDGIIVYRYPRLELVAQFALETLFDLSPVLSGEYRNAHTLFVDNTPVANLKDWRSGQEIVIANSLPYARKIEVGAMKMRVPGTDHVYQQARAKVAGRYGNMATVTFTYRAIVGGLNIDQDKAAVSRWRNAALNRPATGAVEKTLRPAQHNKSNVRFPVLVIRER